MAEPKPARENGEANSAEQAHEGATMLAALEEKIAKLEGERDDLKSTMVRRQADFENFKKRLERERHEEGQRGVARLAEHLLPVVDAFERAIAAHDNPAYENYRLGFEMIYKQLTEALTRQGVQRIEAEGKQFDPHFHQAIERVETEEHADGAVIEVLQPGYVFHGRVLRPATVRVAVSPQESTKRSAH
ncbi:MAG TPA: nucleotide exchange factor GrpE [Candidatus Acidoferrales bacterium]|nr:nucleotide exchange factor GrpE [Candidatus Acidoferrales bacterium]